MKFSQHIKENNNTNSEKLVDACRVGYLVKVKELISKGVNVQTLSNGPLNNASMRGHLDIVKYLVEKGADIHSFMDFPLRHSSSEGHLDIVKYLVEKGANIHVQDDASLILADYYNHLDVAKYLVSKYDPQYILDKLPKFIKYLGPEYSHAKLADKLGVFSDD